jgi:leucyl/phenylalanyl-tRNA--protein transferase
MPVYVLDESFSFPPPELAMGDGLLAIGGDLKPERLLAAYRQGIFPWFNEDEIPMWWSPDPRFVLFPEELKVSKSMQQLMRKDHFEFRFDTDFQNVINHCRNTERAGQDGTWISEEVEAAYTELHHMGYAHSAETWYNGQLVGGLYGILLGRVFFGESMFSHHSNASKYAFIHWVRKLQETDVAIIDCQIYTGHLESLGARMIPRKEFMDYLQQYAG